MDYNAGQFWLSMISTGSSIIVGVYVYLSNKEKVTNKRFDALTKRIGELESKIERRKECPHHPAFELRLDSIDRGVSKVDGRLEGIGRMVDLLTQNELSGGKQQ